MELTYYCSGDYLFPNLTIKDEGIVIGKYGMLRKTYLKEHRQGMYQGMLLGGTLDSHLAQIDKAAEERLETMMEGLLEKYPAPDKAENQMGWVAHMNSLKAMAEESILQELVYN